MPIDNEFINYLHELFHLFGPIRARKMFGGYGIYHQGLMFALVDDEVLYLKTDAENIHFFTELELPAFEYQKQGKVTRMSYYQAPDNIFEDPDEAALWAARSFQAALRARR